tara:strand:+ start:12425 stop:12643 length:219 start_codon:yes stop_codon:yes gene_type:complete
MNTITARKIRRAGMKRSDKPVASEAKGTMRRSALRVVEFGDRECWFHATKGWRFLPLSEPRRAKRMAAIRAA